MTTPADKELEQEWAKYIRDECHTIDTEDNHARADDALITLLIALGYDDIVAAWADVEKWYA